jgi:hypothetical protein
VDPFPAFRENQALTFQQRWVNKRVLFDEGERHRCLAVLVKD